MREPMQQGGSMRRGEGMSDRSLHVWYCIRVRRRVDQIRTIGNHMPLVTPPPRKGGSQAPEINPSTHSGSFLEVAEDLLAHYWTDQNNATCGRCGWTHDDEQNLRLVSSEAA